MYEEVTVASVVITRPADAPALIHQALHKCLAESRPVFIEIACNISQLPITMVKKDAEAPVCESCPYGLVLPDAVGLRTPHVDKRSLNAAVEHTIRVLNASKSPVLVGGPQLRDVTMSAFRAACHRVACESCGCAAHSAECNDFLALSERTGIAFALTLDGKAAVNERHANYIGLFIGESSVVSKQSKCLLMRLLNNITMI